MDIYYMILYFFVYGFLGWCAEVGFAAVKEHKFVNRGFLNGPICPIYGVGVTIVIAFLTPYKDNLILLYISSVILVTLLEGVTGWAMDKIFHNKWWDYSKQPFNIGGYVCLIFSLVWGIACVAIMDLVHPLIHQALTFIPHTLGIVLMAVLGIAMFADLYVTASAIFKFNKRLASMEKIAGELHEISDQIGEDIYETVITAMEKQEASRQKLDEAAAEWKEKTQEATSGLLEKTQETASGLFEKTQETASGLLEKTQEISDEMRSRIDDLKTRYQDLSIKTPKVSRRLVKAFPKMESRNYKVQLEELRKKVNERRRK
ncbi:putative ABC transporter permease [Faecalicatena orotica]|uniref:putative ABC transporter permease n=1 Tax=Faecalicatena orotica TaxID=1544 RepID=UPI0032178BAE